MSDSAGMQTHWYSESVQFDPKTGEALPRMLSDFLELAEQDVSEVPAAELHDRLWRITDHVEEAFAKLIRGLNESPKRIHSEQHIRDVRELDISDIIKLSTRPGRGIREKLAGKPYLQAVQRIMTIDLPENQLLKEFASQFVDWLEKFESNPEFLDQLQDWLQSENAQVISRWKNLPPNNALLSHRNYRRIWDAWRWLQDLEADLQRDRMQVVPREETMTFWRQIAELKKFENVHFAEVPLLFDYDKFEIKTWQDLPIRLLAPEPFEIRPGQMPDVPVENPRVKGEEPVIEVPVSIDLTTICPTYAYEKGIHKCRDKYIWQNWKCQGKSVDLELFNADAVWLHPDATTLTLPDVFFSRSHTREHLDRAYHVFARHLRERFRNDSFVWLVPDFLNDFELEILRRNINAQFPDAQPLPRSVAAVMENLKTLPSGKQELSVFVVDSVGNCPCMTPLIGKYDAELAKRVPATRGYVWERQPSITVESQEEPLDLMSRDVDWIDVDGTWRKQDPYQKESLVISKSIFKELQDFKNQRVINLSKVGSPVQGGVLFRKYQQQAGDIQLWRDHLPELSTKLPNSDGYYQHFYFVKDAVIRPERGVSKSIEVDELFRLPAGHVNYEFPLYQGEGAAQLRYAAVLQSPVFPLKQDVSCRLEMSYTYGSNQPYKLVFVPEDENLPRIQAEWRPVKKAVETVVPQNLPSPTFPTPKTWRDFERCPKKGSDEVSNLIEWCSLSLQKLIEKKGFTLSGDYQDIVSSRYTGVIEWEGYDRNDTYYCRVNVNGHDIFCHSSEFIEPIKEDDLYEGKNVYLNVERNKHGLAGCFISYTKRCPESLKEIVKEQAKEDAEKIRMTLFKMRFPALTIWNGHSLREADCPKEFRETVNEGIQVAVETLQSSWATQDLKEEIFFFLSCLHRDAPAIIEDKLTRALNNTSDLKRYLKNIAFAIGDADLPWQKQLLLKLLSKKEMNDTERSVVMSILSIVFWRSESIVHLLDVENWKWIQKQLVVCLKKEVEQVKQEDFYRKLICIHSELLLALLRTRESNVEEIRNLLLPNSEKTQELVNLVDLITERVIEMNITFDSRINLCIQKPYEFRNTPDILYAIRLYLTGDTGANAIIIEGIDSEG